MKTAIITGASSGLGAEFAGQIRGVFPEIQHLFLTARRLDRLEALKNELEGVTVCAVEADITTEEGLDRLFGQLDADGDELYMLINNAGMGDLGDFDKSDPAKQQSIIDTNISALTAVTRRALEHMCPGGRIINVSSIASFVPNARMAVYSASKYYVRAFSRALGYELKSRDIAVTVVCPGPMSTEFLKVANILHNSKTFETLPYTDVRKVAAGTLNASKKGRPIYTPGFLFKLYRVLSGIIPDTIFMRFAKT